MVTKPQFLPSGMKYSHSEERSSSTKSHHRVSILAKVLALFLFLRRYSSTEGGPYLLDHSKMAAS